LDREKVAATGDHRIEFTIAVGQRGVFAFETNGGKLDGFARATEHFAQDARDAGRDDVFDERAQAGRQVAPAFVHLPPVVAHFGFEVAHLGFEIAHLTRQPIHLEAGLAHDA
jgi:hypothetical protein